MEDVVPYSEKIGWKQFNQVVQALYILAELYSTTPYISYNDSVNRPKAAIQWLRYLLGRNLQYQWRWDVWKIYEMYVEAQGFNTPDSEFDIDFLDEILTSNCDGVGLISAVYVSYGTDWMADTNAKKKKEADDPEHHTYTTCNNAVIVIVLAMLAMIVAITYVDMGERRIGVVYAKRGRGGNRGVHDNAGVADG